MDRYEGTVNGKVIVYTTEGIQFGSAFIPYERMTDITIVDSAPPAWRFTLNGKRMQVPYTAEERHFVEPFINDAMVMNSFADITLDPQDSQQDVYNAAPQAPEQQGAAPGPQPADYIQRQQTPSPEYTSNPDPYAEKAQLLREIPRNTPREIPLDNSRDIPHSGAGYRQPPVKQGIGAKFGAFWHKNKRNKVLVIIAALIVIGIVRGIIGGIGSPDLDDQEAYEQPTTTVEATEEDAEATTETMTEATTEATTKAAEAEQANESDGVTPEFKKTMDDYEAFMNDYVEFMKKYENSDDTASMMVDYGEMMAKYAEFTREIDAIDEDELSEADDAYYLEVTGRVTQKLAELY